MNWRFFIACVAAALAAVGAEAASVREILVPAGADLLAVRDRVRRERRPGERVKVVLADGVYSVTNRIDLDDADSLTEWTAAHRGKASVIGGWSFRLGEAKDKVDADLVKRLPVEARGAVRAIRVPEPYCSQFPSEGLIGNGPSLSQNLVTYTGRQWCTTDRRNSMPRQPVFTIDQRYQWPARWPNDEKFTMNTNFVVREVGKGTNALVRLAGDRQRRWKLDDETDAILFGLIRGCFYSMERVRIAGLDQATGALELSTTNYLTYGGMQIRVVPHTRYAAINIPEELDQPGEWYFRRKTGQLVFYPPKDSTDESLCALGTFGDHFFHVTGRGIRLEGLAFTAKHSHPAVCLEGTNNVVRGCVFSGLGHIACYVGGRSNLVTRSLFRDTTSTSCLLGGGSEGALNPHVWAGNAVENCLFRHSNFFETGFSRGQLTLLGSGNAVRHCDLSGSRVVPLTVTGFHQMVEYNRVHDGPTWYNDSGACYLSGWPVTRWNTVRYNDFSSVPGDIQTLYLDDTSSYNTCYGNVIRNGGKLGCLVGGGRGNVISNNVFHSCWSGILMDSRGMSWPAYKNTPVEPLDNAFVNNAFVDIQHAGVYMQISSKYTLPKDRFTCRGNVCFQTRGDLFGRRFSTGLNDETAIRVVRGAPGEPLDVGFADLPEPLCDYSSYMKGMGPRWDRLADFMVTGFDVLPYVKGDFTLKDGALILKEMPDFEPIPWGRIGIERAEKR